MPTTRRRPILLWGPPAAGKSTVGRLLAGQLARPFVDLDDEIAAKAGATPAEIFATRGEGAFRALEAAELRVALAREDAPVVALGAGALCLRQLRHEALRRSHLLALDATPATLRERARDSTARPLLADDDGASLARLLEARQPMYAEAHARIDANGTRERTLQAVAAAAHDLESVPTALAPLGERSCRVRVEPLAALASRVAALRPGRVLLLADAATEPFAAALQAAFPEAVRILLPQGAQAKSLATLASVWDAALVAQADRSAVLVAIGGGAVTDLGGFAAATLLRGIRCAFVPTTLLGMVDASIGGKTGIDLDRGKNLVGAFHQPEFVHCDPAALRTLPAAALRAGLAEVAKIALCCDAALLAQVERDAARLAHLDQEALADLLLPAIQAKIDVVANDEREQDRRELLNFGHTAGHGIEAASGFALEHGLCVAIGMRIAIAVGVRVGVTPPDVARRATALLDALGLPTAPPVPVDAVEAAQAMRLDKKRRHGNLRFVLLDGAASASMHAVDEALADAALRAALQGPGSHGPNPHSPAVDARS